MNTTLKNQYFGRLLAICLVVVLAGCGSAEQWETADGGKPERDWEDAIAEVDGRLLIPVEIRFNGRADDLDLEIEVKQDATVFAATSKALQSKGLELKHLGDGETAFVESIGGVVNEKAAGDNWLYRVNGELGSVGCGVAKLKKGDRITWSFGKYEFDN